jgi:hypothetical protein
MNWRAAGKSNIRRRFARGGVLRLDEALSRYERGGGESSTGESVPVDAALKFGETVSLCERGGRENKGEIDTDDGEAVGIGTVRRFGEALTLYE